MGSINKIDLKYNDYSWSTYSNDDPKVTEVPDNTLLNRHEGYEVLYLINKLAEIWKFERKSSGVKIERMIKEHLPDNIKSQIEIRKWIHDNWDKY